MKEDEPALDGHTVHGVGASHAIAITAAYLFIFGMIALIIYMV